MMSFHPFSGGCLMSATPDVRGNPPGQLIDQLCDSFEDAWLSGAPVSLESVVQSAPEAVRAQLFRELLAIEGEYRAKRNSRSPRPRRSSGSPPSARGPPN